MQDLQTHATQVAQLIQTAHPAPVTELTHTNEFELFVAVCMSAQTTDKKVNQLSGRVFAKYKSFSDLANASVSDVEALIYGVNFHKGKAERLVKAGKLVMSKFGGKLPRTLNELITIPGVARKTANVLLQELWNISEGIVVDTHITRVSQRLGLTKNTDAVKIEKDLMALVPKEYWRTFSGGVVLHGRYVCIARLPKCGECKLNQICPSAFKFE